MRRDRTLVTPGRDLSPNAAEGVRRPHAEQVPLPMRRALFALLLLAGLPAVASAETLSFSGTVPQSVPLPPRKPPELAAEPAKPMAAPVVTMSTYLPPKRFDHEYRGAPLMIIRLDTSEQIRRVCIADWKPGHDVACAIPGWHGGCMIAILEDDVLIARGFSPEHVMRHEIGHCNGWSGHAGAIDPRIK
jgi:hypothetical protein